MVSFIFHVIFVYLQIKEKKMSSKNSNSSRDITWDYARGVAIFMIVLHHFIPNPLTSYPEQIKPHQETHHRIICAERLNYQKGFDLLIESFALIADQCPEWHIDIFGSGTCTKNLESRNFIHPATDHIFEEFQNSDFFVFSSRFEGW